MRERRGKDGALLGPCRGGKWFEWRQARDKRIAAPRRSQRPEPSKRP